MNVRIVMNLFVLILSVLGKVWMLVYLNIDSVLEHCNERSLVDLSVWSNETLFALSHPFWTFIPSIDWFTSFLAVCQSVPQFVCVWLRWVLTDRQFSRKPWFSIHDKYYWVLARWFVWFPVNALNLQSSHFFPLQIAFVILVRFPKNKLCN